MVVNWVMTVALAVSLASGSVKMGELSLLGLDITSRLLCWPEPLLKSYPSTFL